MPRDGRLLLIRWLNIWGRKLSTGTLAPSPPYPPFTLLLLSSLPFPIPPRKILRSIIMQAFRHNVAQRDAERPSSFFLNIYILICLSLTQSVFLLFCLSFYYLLSFSPLNPISLIFFLFLSFSLSPPSLSLSLSLSYICIYWSLYLSNYLSLYLFVCVFLSCSYGNYYVPMINRTGGGGGKGWMELRRWKWQSGGRSMCMWEGGGGLSGWKILRGGRREFPVMIKSWRDARWFVWYLSMFYF